MSSTQLLGDWYRQSFRPTIFERFTYKRILLYDRAIIAFDAFAGGGLALGFITEKLLSEFVLAPDAGHDPTYRRTLADCIRRVVRDWDPRALAQPRDCQILKPLAPAAHGTLRHYLESVYIPRAMLGCTKAAKEINRAALRRLADHFGRDVLLGELSDELAADHLQWLLDQGVPPVSVNTKHRQAIFCVWRHAFRSGAVGLEPRIPKLREERREPDAWTPGQMADLLDAALRFQPNRRYHGIPRNLWWHAIVLVCWWTALRRGTLLALRRSDVNLQTGWLSVQPAMMKNRRGKKFRLGPDAVEAIAKIWKPDRELLFPALDIRHVGRQMAAIVADAGIPPSDRPGFNKFHAIRRTVATQAAIAGGITAASALLGHSGAEVTMRYVDPSKLPGCDATLLLPAIQRSA